MSVKLMNKIPASDIQKLYRDQWQIQIYLPSCLGKVNYSISTTVMQKKISGINNQNQPRVIQFLIYDLDPHEGKILLRIKAIYLKN